MWTCLSKGIHPTPPVITAQYGIPGVSTCFPLCMPMAIGSLCPVFRTRNLSGRFYSTIDHELNRDNYVPAAINLVNFKGPPAGIRYKYGYIY